MKTCLALRSTLVAYLALAAPALASGVIVVDPAGGPGATLLQAALDASQPGDILLLEAGDYSQPGAPIFTGEGGRVIVADSGVVATLAGLRLSGASSSPTVLRDLVIAPTPANPDGAFQLLATGAAWIEGCTASAIPGEGALFSPTALTIQNGTTVYVIRAKLQGAPGVDAHVGPGGTPVPASGGGHGLAVVGNDLTVVHDSLATGGAGADGMPDLPFKASGGAGLSIGFGEMASILGGTYIGGDEGPEDATVSASGAGAACSFLDVQVRDATLVPGAVFGAGTQAPPLALGLADLVEFDAAVRTLELTSPVRELQPVMVAVHGQVGDLAAVIVATDFGGMSAPLKQGVYAFPAGFTMTVPLGTVTDPSGAFTSTMRLGRLPPGLDGMVLYAQLLVADAQGQALLGTASSVVWLSATL